MGSDSPELLGCWDMGNRQHIRGGPFDVTLIVLFKDKRTRTPLDEGTCDLVVLLAGRGSLEVLLRVVVWNERWEPNIAAKDVASTALLCR